MPSKYRKEFRSDPYDASMENLAKARASCRYHPPRPWRSSEQSLLIRRYVAWWLTCRDPSRPSGRAWARELGISHTWLQKLVLEFTANPDTLRELLTGGSPRFEEFQSAQQSTREMARRGELRRRATLRLETPNRNSMG
jgi:hypothetical protein